MDKAFRLLTTEEFQALSIEERWEYLRLAMADIREKLEDTKKQSERLNGDRAADV